MTDKALVIGGGTMGIGIAEVLLDAGADVTVVEPNATVAGRVRERLGDRPGLTIVDAATRHDVELVVEAVPEDVGLKQQVLSSIERAVRPDTVLATNTSSLSITTLGSTLTDAGRFIGMHFFNPVPKSSLVEIVAGDDTTDATTHAAQRWVERLGKESIVVRDAPGFATSRLGLALGLEAIRMVEDGVATAEDIDRGIVLGYRHPIGPLKLTDMIGLDVRLAIAEHLSRELGARFEPPALLRDKVARGELGKKTGKGFYEWS